MVLLARRDDVCLGQGAAIESNPCGPSPSHLVEGLDLHALRPDIFAVSALPSVQMHLHSAGNFSKELVVHPHHSMVLLMGRFLSAKVSAKRGGRHSSSVSDPPCSLLPPGALSNTMRCVAPVPEPSVVRGGLGGDAAFGP